MAIVDTPIHAFWPQTATGDRFAVNANASGEGAAWIFQAPQAGDITHLVFATANVVTGLTADGRIEGVNTTTGLSNGTPITNGTGTLAINNTDDNLVLELPINSGTGATVTCGQLIACSVTSPATPGDWNIVYGSATTGYIAQSFPYCATNTGLWAKSGPLQPIFGLRYSGGVYVHIPGMIVPNTALPGVSGLNSGSSPDENGNRFVPAIGMRCVGAEIHCPTGTGTGDYRVCLRNSSGTLLASSPTIDGDAQFSALVRRHLFTAAVDLVASTEYDITVEMLSGAAGPGVWSATVGSNAILGCAPGGAGVYRVRYTDGASRTTTNTEVLAVAPLVSGYDSGGAAAALVLNSRSTSHLRR